MTAAPVPFTDRCGSRMKDHLEAGWCERFDVHCGLGSEPEEGLYTNEETRQEI